MIQILTEESWKKCRRYSASVRKSFKHVQKYEVYNSNELYKTILT